MASPPMLHRRILSMPRPHRLRHNASQRLFSVDFLIRSPTCSFTTRLSTLLRTLYHNASVVVRQICTVSFTLFLLQR